MYSLPPKINATRLHSNLRQTTRECVHSVKYRKQDWFIRVRCWSDNLHIRTWPYSFEIYRICENKLPTSRLSKVTVW